MAKKKETAPAGINFEEFFIALDLMEKEYRIPKEEVIDALESGLASAYKKEYGGEESSIKVNVSEAGKNFRVYSYKKVVDDDDFENEKEQILYKDAITIDPNIEIGQILLEDITPTDFSRIAAQTAKQVIVQRINDIKKQMVLSEMSERTGEVVTAIVRRIEGNTVYVEITNSQMEGIMMQGDQIPTEKYNVNDVIKVYVKKIKENTVSGSTQVIVSRSAPGFVRKLIEMEVPEVKARLVEIKSVVREAGERTKIAVVANDPNVDAVGAIIGNKGSRVNSVVAEIGGYEKIDVVEYTTDPIEYIARALSPATVMMVTVNETDKTAKVIVPDEKLSLAIGKRGQNARLAAKLTEFKIDVKPYSSLNVEEIGEQDAE